MLETIDINKDEVKEEKCIKAYVRNALKTGITAKEAEDAEQHKNKIQHNKEKNTISR